MLEGEGSKLRKATDRQQSCDEGSAEQEGPDDAGDTAVNARVQETQGQVYIGPMVYTGRGTEARCGSCCGGSADTGTMRCCEGHLMEQMTVPVRLCHRMELVLVLVPLCQHHGMGQMLVLVLLHLHRQGGCDEGRVERARRSR